MIVDPARHLYTRRVSIYLRSRSREDSEQFSPHISNVAIPRREGEENARERVRGGNSAARRDAAVQSVTKPEIKQHRE